MNEASDKRIIDVLIRQLRTLLLAHYSTFWGWSSVC